MNKETTCCFTGPRPARLPGEGNEFSFEITNLKTAVKAAVRDAYDEGFRFFISGMAEGFDLFAAEAVLELKDEFADIYLVAALPYKDAAKNHRAKTRTRMEEVLQRADLIYSVFENYIPGCELSRDRYMVDHSSRIIGYYNGLSKGTAYTWEYALENELETVNLYECEL